MSVVLIFDPSPASVLQALAGLNVVAACAPSAARIGAALKRLQPDLLICDISASDISGRVIAEKAQAISPATRVLFTGPPICRLQTLRLVERKLVDGFLPKPWQVGALHTAIASLLPDAADSARTVGARVLKLKARPAVSVIRRLTSAEALDGRYRLDDLIGEGGSGRVYRAHDLLLDMPVAIKLLHPNLYHDTQALGELQSEARICMSLAHPHIVRLYNLDKRGGHYLLVMEYIDGSSLAAALPPGQLPDRAFVRCVIRAVADALDYAHGEGVTHSDLTPANILIGSSGIPKLIDFGMGTLANQQAPPGELIAGTLSYMSPEQLRGEPVAPATDIFAFGVIACQMLSGYLPQAADATVADLAHRPRPQPGGLPGASADVIRQALAMVPADRWPSAGAFANALLNALEDSP